MLPLHYGGLPHTRGVTPVCARESSHADPPPVEPLRKFVSVVPIEWVLPAVFRRCPRHFIVASVRKGWCLGAPTHGRGRDPREGGPHPDDRYATPRAVDRDRSRLFAERGYEATSIEEIAQRAHVSKPVVYEHFGGKEGLYAVVVDREMSRLLEMVTSSLKQNRSRVRVERVALALLTYVEEHTDGFRILVRDSPVAAPDGTYSSLLNEAIGQVGHILAGDFSRRGFNPDLALLYAQALVGMVSTTATWWLDERTPPKEVVAAHLSTCAGTG